MKVLKISVLAMTLSLMSFSTISNSVEKTILNILTNAITWKSESIDLGQIPQGTPKKIEYEFKNTSKSAIIITNVQGSCGCTTTDYTKTPILPGETAKVSATYNAANKGSFSKTVTVTTNAEKTPKVLTFKGIVI
jgi:Protein of unknown function (DUF1573)